MLLQQVNCKTVRISELLPLTNHVLPTVAALVQVNRKSCVFKLHKGTRNCTAENVTFTQDRLTEEHCAFDKIFGYRPNVESHITVMSQSSDKWNAKKLFVRPVLCRYSIIEREYTVLLQLDLQRY